MCSLRFTIKLRMTGNNDFKRQDDGSAVTLKHGVFSVPTRNPSQRRESCEGSAQTNWKLRTTP